MRITAVDGVPVPGLEEDAPVPTERKTIYKYPVLPIDDEIKMMIHEGAEYLCVQTQQGIPCLWALVDLEKPLAEKWFCIRGTGCPFKGNEGKYISTFQLYGGSLVFHIFEKLEKAV